MKAAAQVGLGTEPLKSLPSVLLCILKRANREQSKEWIKTLPDSSTIDTQMAEKHFEIGHFAMGAYAASMVKDTSRMLDVLGKRVFMDAVKYRDFALTSNEFLTQAWTIRKTSFAPSWIQQAPLNTAPCSCYYLTRVLRPSSLRSGAPPPFKMP